LGDMPQRIYFFADITLGIIFSFPNIAFRVFGFDQIALLIIGKTDYSAIWLYDFDELILIIVFLLGLSPFKINLTGNTFLTITAVPRFTTIGQSSAIGKSIQIEIIVGRDIVSIINSDLT